MKTLFKVRPPSRIAVILAFFAIFVIWGSTFMAISVALQGFPPFLLSAFRFLIAGILLFVWRSAKGEMNSSAANWQRNGMIGILILAGGTGLVGWSEQYVTATEAAVVIAGAPFWFIALDRSNWRANLRNPAITTGLILGFSGLVLFLAFGSQSGKIHATTSQRAMALVVLGISSVFWVLGSLYSKKHKAGGSTVMNTAQQLLIGGLTCLLIGTAKGETQAFSINQVPPAAWVGLLYLVLGGSIATYLAYIWLLSIMNPATVSTHTFINPVVAVLLGWIFMGEVISHYQIAGLVVILAGVFLTTLHSRLRFMKNSRRPHRTHSRCLNPS